MNLTKPIEVPFSRPKQLAPFDFPKPLAPFSKSRAAMLHHILSGGVGGVRGGSLHNDDFSDNVRDATFWDTLLVAGGTVAENNQRVECSTAAVNDESGYVTVNAHNLTTSSISTNCSFGTVAYVFIYLCLTKVTVTSPGAEANWYRVLKNIAGPPSDLQVHRQVAGVFSNRHVGIMGANPSVMGVTIAGGTINFWENGVMFHNEVWPFGTYMCYIYISVSDGGTPKMGWHDDFLGSN